MQAESGAEMLKRWINDAGHSYRSAAALVGTSHVSIQRYLKGVRPPVDVAIRLREVANIPIEAWT